MSYYEEDLPNTSDESLKSSPSPEDFEKALDVPTPRNVPMEEMIARRVMQETKSLNDIGSRYDHYSELLVIWEEYVSMMEKRAFLGRDELIKKMGIELAIKQLRKTIMGMRGYSDQVGEIKALVDGVPKDAKLIFGGRGKALSAKGFEDMG